RPGRHRRKRRRHHAQSVTGWRRRLHSVRPVQENTPIRLLGRRTVGKLRRVGAALTYANIMSTLAFMLALGGTAWAAATITSADIVNETVRGVDIKNGEVRNAELANSAVTSAKIANRTILARDIAPGNVRTEEIRNGTIR